MKRVVWYTVIVLLTLAGLILLWQFREAAILFFLSLATAAALRPAIEFLHKLGLPRSLAIILTYILGIGAFLLLVLLASGPLLTELQRASDQFAFAYSNFKNVGANSPEYHKFIAQQLPPLDALYKAITGNQGASLARALLGFAAGFFDTFSRLAIVVVLSIYWSIDIVHFERLWISVLPANQRTRARDIGRGIEKGVGAYIRSELIQSLLAAILLWVVYSLMGLSYPTLLAILGALAWLIPWLGILIAVVPPLLVGLLISPPIGFAAALVTIVILGALELFVEPRIFYRNRYSSLLIVLLVVALSDVFGLIGLIIAPPLAAAIQIFFRNLISEPATLTDIDPLTQITQLRTELNRVREIGSELDANTPQVASLMERLNTLINKTEEVVKTENSL